MSTTETRSNYENLEHMSVHDLLININNEDKTVPHSIELVLPSIESLG
jgi:N-acetylmuramic acid 6-phosphate etherase